MEGGGDALKKGKGKGKEKGKGKKKLKLTHKQASTRVVFLLLKRCGDKVAVDRVLGRVTLGGEFGP
jgi:hypothetical protein